MPPKFSRTPNSGRNNGERVGLLDDADSDDDFFLKGPPSGSEKVRQVQRQVGEVVGVMQTNIDKVLDRGERLEDLQDKSENLADTATDFNVRARRLQKRMWWKQMKMKICLGASLALIILIIVLSVALKARKT
uniref:vesicle-associated membrane protein 4-like n=1 Tax=Styela clava TaxID=7725 RepID=UPI0019399574|nr:vesicle-associated membrane protein 4-like [Styela clava]